jgi:hypothetical protein
MSTRPPKELDAIADVVLAYRPKPKTKPVKKRRKMQKRIIEAQAADDGESDTRKKLKFPF